MYQQFFALRKDPFAMTPDPSFLYLTAAHREALAGLTYAILSRKGFVVLTGDAGTGKTTLLTRILQSIPATRARFSVVLNPMLTPSEFLELALVDFGLTNIPTSKAQRLIALQQFLVASHSERKVPVLVVDEAHKLSPEVLEEIRLLSNFELAEGKLLQIVLAGQSELGNVLNRDDLRQLKQRIAVRLSIQPLASAEVGQYIQHRWSKAGSTQNHPFDTEALALIWQCSRGIPRSVNVICDNALMLAFGEGATEVGVRQIQEVARDLDLSAPGGRILRQVDRPGMGRADSNGPLNGAAEAPLPSAVPTLERYLPPSGKPSKLRKLAGLLGMLSIG